MIQELAFRRCQIKTKLGIIDDSIALLFWVLPHDFSYPLHCFL
ncbi:hypothetical protein H206_06154 [Candidatus Electrothrix aarhusensis]|uniref:Uncharacterized protein n=1 Tax=Candidatus Electrothrix aarhusensis TaxID=1859131 RepID=A0A3S4TCG4_9BACT|nr:hypothetical protein H206_06154 [Candidatus Electrothrix aarhusensis]